MKYIKIFIFLAIINNVIAQNKNDKILMTIDRDTVYLSEFLRIYNKNGSFNDTLSPRQYVSLFVNYKLKVKDAIDSGYDTLPKLKKEFNNYVAQLAKPYLTDKSIYDKLITEAYNRMKYDVRAEHILIKVDENASPEDTALAYKKIMNIYNKIKEGQKFEVLARKYSDDKITATKGGDLGYFTVFQMVYPFESAAYNTPVGQVSNPVRTKYGYHLIKVLNKRPARGLVKVAHIFVKIPQGASEAQKNNAKKKIFELYNKLKNGEDFKELVQKYSDDKASARKGGELPWFGTGRMVEEFEDAAFSLKNKGDISAPVQSPYGWHIIKLIDKKDIPSFEEEKNQIKIKINRDSRSNLPIQTFINKLKKEYNFKLYPEAKEEVFSLLNDSFLKGKWKANNIKTEKTVFEFDDIKVSQKNLLDYLEQMQGKIIDNNLRSKFNKIYNKFEKEKLLEYEKSQLPKKYPEYKALLKEYHDGILLFEITDKKIWSKALNDTIGLKKFYEEHKNQFMWDKRVEASIYSCKDEKIAEKVKKLLKKVKKGKISNNELLNIINKDSQLKLKIENGKFSKGDNEIIDKVEWKEGIKKIIDYNGQKHIVYIKKVLQAQVKKFNEAKGSVITEYQKFLEKQWLDSLKNKYPVKINWEVLNDIK